MNTNTQIMKKSFLLLIFLGVFQYSHAWFEILHCPFWANFTYKSCDLSNNQEQNSLSVERLWLKNSMDSYWDSPVNWKANGKIILNWGSTGEDLWVEIGKKSSDPLEHQHPIGNLRNLYFFCENNIYIVYDTDKKASYHKFIRMVGNCFVIGYVDKEHPSGKINEVCKVTEYDKSRIIKFLNKYLPLN